MIDVELRVSRVFEETQSSTTRIVINRGGTRSTKTVSMCQLIGLWLLEGKLHPDQAPDTAGTFTVFRRYAADIERTVLNDWYMALDQLGISSFVAENKTLKTFKFGKRLVRFMGFDDEASLRGYASVHCYLNEADQMTKSAFDQVAPRTTGRIFLDFNPDDEDSWINIELEQRRAVEKKDVTVIVSSYLDNPFLSREQVEEIEYRRDIDPVWWAAFGMGKYASKRGRIFQFDIVSEPPKDVPFKGYGLDFGYTNSPTALLAYWETDKDIWLKGLLYETGLQNQDIVDRLHTLITNRKDYILADPEDPKAIDFIAGKGYNIHRAVKGPDSVEFGISYLKGKRIHLVAGDEDLRSNFRKYKWKVSRDGTPLNEPIKMDDHYPDAARYIGTYTFSAPKTDRDFFN